MAASACPGCGEALEALEGPTHAYIESSPACWAMYGEVLAREYSDPAYMAVHRLTVDTYAVQHPGQPSRRSIQSVGVHLIALHLVLEAQLPFAAVTNTLGALVARTFTWLEPPAQRGALTIAHVHAADSAEDHAARVQAWARSTWTAWSAHHDQVRAWLEARP